MSEQHDYLSDKTIGLLSRLVAFDSVSRNSNIPVIDFIRRYLESFDIPCTPLPTKDGKKANLLARIGPEVEGGVILSGHTDVVPIDGQDWQTDPFTVTEKDGKLYGRGTSDMKSFIALCLAFAPEFKKLSLSKPIWLAFSYDEEVGCLGAPHLLKHIVKNVPKPSYAIIGEPTSMQVVTAHKGVLSFETTVTGLEWHSSQPHLGVNSVHIACELVTFLSNMAAEVSTSGKRDERFDPIYSTIHVGVINGGTARNIIPRECKFSWEIRPLPGDSADAYYKRFDKHCDEVRQQIKQKYDKADIVTTPKSRMAGVTLPLSAQDACKNVMRCALTNQEHAVSFGTEAGIFNDHGVPAIICGPGSIEQAHKPNEFIELAQIRAGVEFMLRFAGGLT